MTPRVAEIRAEGGAPLEERVDRTVARLVAGGGLILVVGEALPGVVASHDYAAWWNLGGAALVVATFVVAAIPRSLSARTFTMLCLGMPALGMLLNATTFMAFTGQDADAESPWVWTLEPITASLLMLRVPRRWAIAAALSSALLPVLSGYVALGHTPETVLVLTPWHLANVAFVVIFAAIRTRLLVFGASEDAVRREAEQRARVEAEARRLEALGLLVHDEVLTVLAVAAGAGRREREPLSEELRSEARHALELLVGERSVDPGTADEPGALVAWMSASLRRLDPSMRFDVEMGEGPVPPHHVVTTLLRAAAEAVRNSVRHAGTGAARHVTVRGGASALEIVVEDDGCGFADVDGRPDRLGIRVGILERVRALPGGVAEVRSTPGVGTSIVLGWSA